MNKTKSQLKPQTQLRPSKPHHPPGDDGLNRAITISVGLHLAIAAALTLKAVIYPSEPLRLERSIRVDMVGLPEKMKELPPALKEPIKEAPKAEPPKPEAAKVEPPKPEPVQLPDKTQPPPKSDKVSLNNTKKAQTDALKRLEALSKIESMVKNDADAKVAEAKTAAQPRPVKGNEISPGSSLTGLAKIENDRYLEELDEHVKKHWNVPNFLATAKLSASVVVYVDERGNIIKKQLVRASGNQIFDQTVLDSLDRASPFPPPPSRLVNVFMVDGIQLGFPD